MKKIVILNGAGKRNGNTASLIRAFTEGAENAGNEVKEFYLQTMNIRGCMDCQGCSRKPKGDNQPCVQKDDMQQIYDAYLDCDVVVFTTPVYWFTISGQLKTAVDRLYAIQRNQGFDACKKDTVFIMTSGVPAEMAPQPIAWYQTFEKQMGWKNLGMVLGTRKESAAKASGVKYIAYTSICEPQYKKFGLEINHKQTEELIRQTGISHTFLRNGWYLEMMMPYLEASAKMGAFSYYAGDAKVAWTAKRDLAEAGARVIAYGYDEEILELSGNAVTYAELARSSGKDMEIKPVSRNEFMAVMARSVIPQMGMMLAQSYQDYAVQGSNGEEKLTSAVLEKVIGHKLLTAAEMI